MKIYFDQESSEIKFVIENFSEEGVEDLLFRIHDYILEVNTEIDENMNPDRRAELAFRSGLTNSIYEVLEKRFNELKDIHSGDSLWLFMDFEKMEEFQKIKLNDIGLDFLFKIIETKD